MKTLILENDIKDINISGTHQVIDRFFGQNGKKTICLDSGSNLEYLCLMLDCDLDLDFTFLGENCTTNIYCIFIGKNKEKVKSKISTFLNKNKLYANVYLLCVACDDAKLQVNGNIDISAGISGVEGYLKQEQVILGKNISVKMVPTLVVGSNDVKASHSAKIDKFDKESLFYMMTKGLNLNISQRLVLEGYYRNILDKFDSFDEDYRESLLKYLVEQSFVN